MFSKKPIHIQDPRAYIFLGVAMEIHLSGAQTGGEFSMIGATMPPGGDGGLHVHKREDESIYLLDGSLDVTIGEETFTLKAGQSYFAPRNIPHRVMNSSDVPARAVLIHTPGTFDEFISKAGVPVGQDSLPPSPPDAAQGQNLLTLAEEFGIEILVPPELTMRK